MVQAKKSLGQNFLKDKDILNMIIEAADLSKEDHVLEIGPGKGALTDFLIEKAGKVTAVELDDRLIPFLRIDYGNHKNFELVHADALKYEPPPTPYKIVANIPYYITSPLINHYLKDQFLAQLEHKENKQTKSGNPAQAITIMIQKEVAEKILAKADKNGDQKHSVLSLQVHLFGTPELVCYAPKEAFEPRPKVDSAVIKITIDSEPKIALENAQDLKDLFWLLHMCFKQKRKKLTNNLSAALRIKASECARLLEDLKIDPSLRAEDLKISDWGDLHKARLKEKYL